jgi:CRP-like cAMP-binding protein
MSDKSKDPLVASMRLQLMKEVFKLKDFPVFAGLSAEQLLPVVEQVEKRETEPHEIVIQRGAKAEALYLVITGSLDAFVGSKHIKRYQPGDFFGELGLLDSEPEPMTIRSVEEANLLSLAADDFHQLVEQNPIFARTFMDTLSTRLRELLSLSHQK